MLSLQHLSPPHSYLFGSDYVSVDALGKVLIISVPLLPLKEVSHSKSTSASTTLVLNCPKQNSCCLKASGHDYKELAMQGKAALDRTSSSETQCMTDVALAISRISNSKTEQEKTLNQVETIPETPILNRILSNEGDCVGDAPDLLGIKASFPQADKNSNNFNDTELSPRLTNMIQSGVVPESPVNNSGQYSSHDNNCVYS